jgi:hypothetical protein
VAEMAFGVGRSSVMAAREFRWKCAEDCTNRPRDGKLGVASAVRVGIPLASTYSGGRVMRGFTLRGLPVCVVAFAVGCFNLSGDVGKSGKSGESADPTHAYWQHVSAILAQKPTSDDIKSNVQLIRTQTIALRDLSPDGVDPALVAAVEELSKCEDEVIRVAEMARCDREILKTNQLMAQQFADSNRRAADAKKQLKALRGQLNDRHGGGFAAMG